MREYDVLLLLVDHFAHMEDVAFVNGFVDLSFVEEVLKDFIANIYYYKTLPKAALEYWNMPRWQEILTVAERDVCGIVARRHWSCRGNPSIYSILCDNDETIDKEMYFNKKK